MLASYDRSRGQWVSEVALTAREARFVADCLPYYDESRDDFDRLADFLEALNGPGRRNEEEV